MEFMWALDLENLSEKGLRGGFIEDAPSGGGTWRLLDEISVCADRPSRTLPFRLYDAIDSM